METSVKAVLTDNHPLDQGHSESTGADQELRSVGDDCGMEPTKRRLQFESTSSELAQTTPARRRTLFEAVYCGFSVLDGHYSRPMLPWIVAETKESSAMGEKVVLRVANGSLLAVSQESREVLFEHGLRDISRYCRCRPEPECFAYLLRATDPDAPLTCHVFLAVGQTNVYELFGTIQSGTQVLLRDEQLGQHTNHLMGRSVASSTTSSAQSSRRQSLPERDGVENYEVLYIGRVELADRKPPSDFIDDAVNKFDKYRTSSLRRIPCLTDSGSESWPYEEQVPCKLIAAGDQRAILDSIELESQAETGEDCSLIDNVFTDAQSTADQDTDGASGKKKASGFSRAMLLLICLQDIRLISLSNKQTLLLRKLHDICRIVKGGSAGDHVGFICRAANFDQYVCYIVKCRSQEIAHAVMQSMKCVITASMEEGKRVESTNNSMTNHCCPLCPMEQFATLCSDLEGLTPLVTHEMILSRIGQLDMRDQERVIADYKRIANLNVGKLANIPEETNTVFDTPVTNQVSPSGFHRRNVILMSLLRNLCESMQKEHEMCPQVGNKRSINLSEVRRRSLSGGDGLTKLFELGDRAKRSFSISLDTLGRKFGKGEELAGHIMDQFTRQHSVISNDSAMTKSSSETGWSPPDTPKSERLPKYHFDTPDQWQSPAPRQRSRTVGEDYCMRQDVQPPAKTASQTRRAPKLHVLSKLAASGMQTPLGSFRQSLDSQSAPSGPLRQRCATGGAPMSTGRRPSWRQAIFQRVVISPNMRNTDSPRTSISSIASMGMPAFTAEDERRMSLVSTASDRSPLVPVKERSNSIADPLGAVDRARVCRARWRRAIMQQILENRLAKHRKMREVERSMVNRMKLEYDEISVSDADDERGRQQWNSMLKHPQRAATRFDRVQVEDAVKAGVPRDLRADVWRFLMEQHVLDRTKRKQINAAPDYDYAELLKDLTPHQHAILIDLGRTFPSHQYFSRQLGAGQLSLFNILKAYSLYDPEVGYCQGLSFIAGALLLHMDEEEAFDALVDLMYRMGLRKQYRPDMLALQVQMYQLSRLLHDRHKDLHTHLEDHEIPMLYAAPWFLTLFASTFPLGFVSRVIDFIFLSGGLDVVFKIALVLLGEHKQLIMHCDSFEAINDFLKSTLPGMGIIQMERVFNAVFELELSRDLLAYEVEYHMLHEELCGPSTSMVHAPHSIESLVDAANAQQSGRRHSVKLEEMNVILQRQNAQLTEQLQLANQRIAALEQGRTEESAVAKETENTIATYMSRIVALEKRVKGLESERQCLRNELSKLTTPMRNGSHQSTDSVVFATPASLPKPKK